MCTHTFVANFIFNLFIIITHFEGGDHPKSQLEIGVESSTRSAVLYCMNDDTELCDPISVLEDLVNEFCRIRIQGFPKSN